MPPAPKPIVVLPNFRRERKLGLQVCGIDEAGRGPLAGPVVAAAVILQPRRIPKGINDSKKLSAEARDALHAEIIAVAQVGVGEASVEEIDLLNILQATMLAMCRAVAALPAPPAFALVDGNCLPGLPCPAEAVIGGDGECLSIAAASIVAKVTRDRLMLSLDAIHPGYGWAHNAGYGTPEHLAALGRLGVTPLHRRSFAPVRLAVDGISLRG